MTNGWWISKPSSPVREFQHFGKQMQLSQPWQNLFQKVRLYQITNMDQHMTMIGQWQQN